MEPMIGIDLGTTNSVVACMKDGRPAVVLNLEGGALTPSIVAFDERGRSSVGISAEGKATSTAVPGQGESYAAAVVSSIKRRMGSDHVVETDAGTFTPVEISAMILEKLKSDAETRLGQPIVGVVVTVPAYFNDNQRRATRQAATMAGLEVRRLVNEPTAAALAYGLHMENAHTVLVWDLGGGTFDVSILELGDGVFEVKAVNGNTHLGGDDYDERLAEILAAEFRRQHGVNLGDDPAGARLLRHWAERAKIQLSSQVEACVTLPKHFARREGCTVTVTRDVFERATADITERMLGPARQALSDARLDPLDLDRVVLVGGMTRVPAVRRLVKEITGLEPYGHIDPDKVVALGAAIQAGVLAGKVPRVTLVDVTPLSLGIETQGGLLGRIIERNTPIPTSRGRLCTNARDDQTEMEIHVLQGERELAADNISLGTFELLGLTPQPRGRAKVEVTFDIDANGMVQVFATDLHTEASIKVRLEAGTSPEQQVVKRMLAESQEQSASDRRKRKELEAGIYAENLIRVAKQLVEEAAQTPTGESVRRATEAAERGASALQDALAGGSLERIEEATGTLEALLRELNQAVKVAREYRGARDHAA